MITNDERLRKRIAVFKVYQNYRLVREGTPDFWVANLDGKHPWCVKLFRQLRMGYRTPVGALVGLVRHREKQGETQA